MSDDAQWEVVLLHMPVRSNLTAEEHKAIPAFLKSAHGTCIHIKTRKVQVRLNRRIPKALLLIPIGYQDETNRGEGDVQDSPHPPADTLSRSALPAGRQAGGGEGRSARLLN